MNVTSNYNMKMSKVSILTIGLVLVPNECDYFIGTLTKPKGPVRSYASVHLLIYNLSQNLLITFVA